MDNLKNDEERKLQVMNTELNIKSLPNQMTSEDFIQHEINRKRRATANTSTGTYLCLYYTKSEFNGLLFLPSKNHVAMCKLTSVNPYECKKAHK